MSQFVIIELFLQFMSEGTGSQLARKQVMNQTKLKRRYVNQVISESDECQQVIQQRKIQQDKTRTLTSRGVDTWV